MSDIQEKYCPVCECKFDAKVPFDGINGLERKVNIKDFENACIHNGKSGYCSIYLHNGGCEEPIEPKVSEKPVHNTANSINNSKEHNLDEYGSHVSDRFNYEN